MTGTNGKTTTTELIGHIHREAGLPVTVAGNVGTALSTYVDALAPGPSSCARSRPSSSRTRSCSPPRAPSCSTSSPTTSIATGHSRPTGPRSSGSSPIRATTTSRSPRPGSASRTSGAARGGSASGSAPASRSASAPGRCGGPTSRCSPVGELRAARRAQSPQRDGGGGRPLARGIDIDAVRDGAADVRGRRAPPRGGRDDRRRALRQRLEGDERRLDARRARELRGHARPPDRSAAAGRARTSRRCARRSRRTCASVELIGEAAPALRDVLGGAARDCGDLERALAAARAAARPGEVVLLSPACASFDQFADFEARGRAFKDLVAAVQSGSDSSTRLSSGSRR